MTPESFTTTMRLIEIGAIGTRVPLTEIGAGDGPPISYAVIDDFPPLILTEPVYLNRLEFAPVFPAGPVQRQGKLICSVRNGFMFSPFGAIVLPEGSILRESLLQTDASAFSFTYAQFKGQFPGRHVMWATAEEKILSLNTYSTNNYFHFLIDALAQIHWRERLPKLRGARMVISGYHPEAAAVLPFIGQALTRAGLDEDAIMPFDGTIMYCRHVVFPSRDTGANPAKIAALRSAFGLTSASRGTARFYITRPGATRRRLTNDVDLAARLAKRGFVSIDPGALTFDQQIAMFASAAIIVGPHGAALTNAAFMPPGGTVVELTHTARVVWTFHEVACASGLSYACVVGDRTSESDNPLFADFSVDHDAVEAAVDASLARIGA